MATVIRVKRPRSEAPAATLMVSTEEAPFKRLHEDNGRSGRAAAGAEARADGEVVEEDGVGEGSAAAGAGPARGALYFRRLCTVEDDGAIAGSAGDGGGTGPALPRHVAAAVRAAWEVRRTRRAIQARAAKGKGGVDVEDEDEDDEEGEEDDDDDEAAVAAAKASRGSSSSSNKGRGGGRGRVPLRVFDLQAAASSSSSTAVAVDGREEEQNFASSSSSAAAGPSSGRASLVRRWQTSGMVAGWEVAAAAHRGTSTASSSSASSAAATAAATASGKPSPTRVVVLSPFQRRMDEAIWIAFKEKRIGPIFDALSLSSGADVNYARLYGDGVTALMGVAFVGDQEAAAKLVRRNALAHLTDKSGKTASDFAMISGNFVLAATLRDIARAEREALGIPDPSAAALEETAVGASTSYASAASSSAYDADGGAAAYDIFVLDEKLTHSASSVSSSSAFVDGAFGDQGPSSSAAASREGGFSSTIFVDPLSFAVARAAVFDEDATGWDGLDELAYEGDGEEDDEDHDSEDSNAEDAPGNDYADEDEGGAGDDDDNVFRGGVYGIGEDDYDDEDGGAADDEDEEDDRGRGIQGTKAAWRRRRAAAARLDEQEEIGEGGGYDAGDGEGEEMGGDYEDGDSDAPVASAATGGGGDGGKGKTVSWEV